MSIFSRRKAPVEEYDREHTYPVFLSSICTGETAAGFRDKSTRKFTEVMLIRTPADLETFRTRYGIGDGEIRKVY